MTGNSGGWQQVDLRPVRVRRAAGRGVDQLRHRPGRPAGSGSFVDDTAVVVGGGGAESEGFETGLGPWAVPGPPAGSPTGGVDFRAVRGSALRRGDHRGLGAAGLRPRADRLRGRAGRRGRPGDADHLLGPRTDRRSAPSGGIHSTPVLWMPPRPAAGSRCVMLLAWTVGCGSPVQGSRGTAAPSSPIPPARRRRAAATGPSRRSRARRGRAWRSCCTCRVPSGTGRVWSCRATTTASVVSGSRAGRCRRRGAAGRSAGCRRASERGAGDGNRTRVARAEAVRIRGPSHPLECMCAGQLRWCVATWTPPRRPTASPSSVRPAQNR